MLISVVIPVYNAIEYLDECIGSVLTQRFGDYEIVLADDGSTDGSGARCDEYAAQYAFIRAVHQPNGGASAARNCGLKEARGTFVHFIDSDDRLSGDGVYEALAQTALQSPYDIVFFRRERFTEGGTGIEAIQPAYKIDGEFDGDVLRHVMTEKYELTLTCPVNKIFRREFLLENDLYFTAGLDHEEDEWLPRVISRARRVWFDKGVYYTVRQHPGSLSKIDTPEKTTDKACSKVVIAATGMRYMEAQDLAPETLSLAAEYYWEYLTDACVTCNQVSAENRRRILQKLKENKQFFKSCRYLKSRNKRLMGRMFRLLGIGVTVKIIGLRYGK